MKAKLLIVLLLTLTGCCESWSETVEDRVKEVNANITALSKQCKRLGKCLKGKAEIASFPNQKHAPYACSITVDQNRSRYFYPDVDLGFGDIGSAQTMFENAIVACELVTKTGEYSDAEIKKREAFFKALDAERDKEQQEKTKKVKQEALLPIVVQ